MPGGFTGGLEKGLKQGIGLALKSMDLDLEKARFDLATQVHNDSLFEKAQELENEATKLEIENLSKEYAGLNVVRANAVKAKKPDIQVQAEQRMLEIANKLPAIPDILPPIMSPAEELKMKLEETEQVAGARKKGEEPYEIAKEKRAASRKELKPTDFETA